MAFKEPYDSDGEVSEWNEALLKMKRLHELQTEINRCSMMPLAKHPMVNEWNYVIWFRGLCALFAEGNAKYKKPEVKEINEIKAAIENLFDTLPVHASSRATSGKTCTIFNKDNWDLTKKLIEDMEYKVRLYNDQHGLSTKNKENMDGRSILR